jgi:beta-lactamase class A
MVELNRKLVRLVSLPVLVVMFLSVGAVYNYASTDVMAKNNIQKPEETVVVNKTNTANDVDEAEVANERELSIISAANAKRIASEQKAADLENAIKAYLGNSYDNIGLSYYDIKTGRQIVINGDKTFLAASTVKVQMNMVLADMIQNGQAAGNEMLQYTEDCYEEGTGILQGQDLLKPLPVELLSKYSIIYSDNIATNMIIKRIDYYNMRNAIDKKLGHTTDHSDNYITANDEAALLRELYENPSKNPYYSKLIDNMKQTEFHDRLDRDIPQNIAAHKVGNYGSYVNDAGIIYTKNPYILSIYTNQVNNPEEVIAHISKMIYDYQNSINN